MFTQAELLTIFSALDAVIEMDKSAIKNVDPVLEPDDMAAIETELAAHEALKSKVDNLLASDTTAMMNRILVTASETGLLSDKVDTFLQQVWDSLNAHDSDPQIAD